MAKKKTEGLLIVEVPDLFAGLDLFEEGWQTAISGAGYRCCGGNGRASGALCRHRRTRARDR
jgi:hypothetical protein